MDPQLIPWGDGRPRPLESGVAPLASASNPLANPVRVTTESQLQRAEEEPSHIFPTVAEADEGNADGRVTSQG